MTADTHEWTLGLFDWLLATRYDGCELCFNILFCAPCMAGYMHDAHFSKNEQLMNPCVAGWLLAADTIGCSSSCYLGIWVNPFLNLLYFIGYFAIAGYSLYQRRSIVAESKIEESACRSFLTVCVCLPCAECQHFAQIEAGGTYPGGCFFLNKSDDLTQKGYVGATAGDEIEYHGVPVVPMMPKGACRGPFW
eukprot:TRINITY_DN7018_c0_g2_i2.p1 TRINITY_DN7018_c0_g2~~TRINITY_DN7018_c0_g2_i2.p1  ORF type:complete len:192 (+),score=36.23 TRINITY_DN7018_c0_g2_i2:64-639(+)